ncbi:hypothetical protein M6B38_121005 [Iris pallida]|uniref:Uncharacterized protein n=1 Tax=Iris pallida TaxID=29817 RepID=A0AAX6H9R8_IRIPA|nr:hypothetical protein M6B38_121005 [Iris pallida]
MTEDFNGDAGEYRPWLHPCTTESQAVGSGQPASSTHKCGAATAAEHRACAQRRWSAIDWRGRMAERCRRQKTPAGVGGSGTGSPSATLVGRSG